MIIDRTKRPEIRQIDSIDILSPERLTMPNGVPLQIIRAGEQDVVRFDMLFRAGPWFQSHKLQAFFTHRMLREGTKKFTSAEIAEKLDFYGAWLEISNTLEYVYVTLYSLSKYFAHTLEILESIVKEPAFPEYELNTVASSCNQQFQVNSKKVDFVAHRTLMTSLFGANNPGGRFAVGEDYQDVHPDMLHAHHQKCYHSGNCSMMLSGKITPDIVELTTQMFGKDTFGKVAPPLEFISYPIETTTKNQIFVSHEDAMQSAVKIGGLSISQNHPDYVKLRVLVTLFGGYFGSRLMSKIREEKGYTYGISMGIIRCPETGVMMISTETDNRYVEDLIKEVYREMDKIQNEPIGEGELTIVRNYMLGETCRGFESPFSLADAWLFIQTARLDDHYYKRSLQAISSVTSTELQQLARQYFCKESLKEVVVGKKVS